MPRSFSAESATADADCGAGALLSAAAGGAGLELHATTNAIRASSMRLNATTRFLCISKLTARNLCCFVWLFRRRFIVSPLVKLGQLREIRNLEVRLGPDFGFKARPEPCLSSHILLLRIFEIADGNITGPANFLHGSWSIHSEQTIEIPLQARGPDRVLYRKKHAVRQDQRRVSNFLPRKKNIGGFKYVLCDGAAEEKDIHLQPKQPY